jgi:hypothetical protein
MPDGSIVLMGGFNVSGGKNNWMNDVWRSTDDGATWTEMTAHAVWSARDGFSSVAMPDGSIVLIGGGNDTLSGLMNDVWRSTDDGATWTEMTAHAGWTPREFFSSVVAPDGSIIVSGGTLPGGYIQFNDVWRSTDNVLRGQK